MKALLFSGPNLDVNHGCGGHTSGFGDLFLFEDILSFLLTRFYEA